MKDNLNSLLFELLKYEQDILSNLKFSILPSIILSKKYFSIFLTRWKLISSFDDISLNFIFSKLISLILLPKTNILYKNKYCFSVKKIIAFLPIGFGLLHFQITYSPLLNEWDLSFLKQICVMSRIVFILLNETPPAIILLIFSAAKKLIRKL